MYDDGTTVRMLKKCKEGRIRNVLTKPHRCVSKKSLKEDEIVEINKILKRNGFKGNLSVDVDDYSDPEGNVAYPSEEDGVSNDDEKESGDNLKLGMKVLNITEEDLTSDVPTDVSDKRFEYVLASDLLTSVTAQSPLLEEEVNCGINAHRAIVWMKNHDMYIKQKTKITLRKGKKKHNNYEWDWNDQLGSIRMVKK